MSEAQTGPAKPSDAILPILDAISEAESLDFAFLLAETTNLYLEAMRRTRLSTKLGPDDIRKIISIFKTLCEVGRMEQGLAKLAGRPSRMQ